MDPKQAARAALILARLLEPDHCPDCHEPLCEHDVCKDRACAGGECLECAEPGEDVPILYHSRGKVTTWPANEAELTARLTALTEED